MKTLAMVGECMLELRGHPGAVDAAMTLAYGGDVYNTAFYARCAGAEVTFISATGDGRYGDWLLQQWQQDGIDIRWVRRIEGTQPALYAIHTAADGERSFAYWRDASPVRRLLDDAQWFEALAAALTRCSMLYYSGITLALLPVQARTQWLQAVCDLRKCGVHIAFDANYRPALWAGGRTEALEWIQRAWCEADVVLPSLDDHQQLQGEAVGPAALADQLLEAGACEVVVKSGAAGALVALPDARETVPAAAPDRVVDTTAAGDSFNGAYLAARLAGRTPIESAHAGARMAARVIAQPGAIIRSVASSSS